MWRLLSCFPREWSIAGKIASWMRTAVGIVESSHIRVMRVADNMRNVAVIEGDKVEAQIKFGWEVEAYPVNEIAQSVDAVSEADVNTLVEEYYDKYEILLEGRDEKEFRKHVAVQAQIEIGFERFLEEKNYQAIVTHFGDLGALKQLPGLAIQRLMGKGYGFGAEGDREDPARLVFTYNEGPGIATSLIDLGNRFRLIINDVECKKVERPMPKLPVATNFWTPKPDMYTGAEAWILAGSTSYGIHL